MHEFELARYMLSETFIKLFHICGKIDSSMNIVGCRPNSFEHESQYLILVNVTLKLHSL